MRAKVFFVACLKCAAKLASGVFCASVESGLQAEINLTMPRYYRVILNKSPISLRGVLHFLAKIKYL